MSFCLDKPRSPLTTPIETSSIKSFNAEFDENRDEFESIYPHLSVRLVPPSRSDAIADLILQGR